MDQIKLFNVENYKAMTGSSTSHVYTFDELQSYLLEKIKELIKANIGFIYIEDHGCTPPEIRVNNGDRYTVTRAISSPSSPPGPQGRESFKEHSL